MPLCTSCIELKSAPAPAAHPTSNLLMMLGSLNAAERRYECITPGCSTVWLRTMLANVEGSPLAPTWSIMQPPRKSWL